MKDSRHAPRTLRRPFPALTVLTVLTILALSTAPWTAPARAAEARPVVFVSILPQKYFVQAIAQDLVDVRVMVQPGAGPATYEPTPGQMAALAGAEAYLAIGVPFESAWLGRFAAAAPALSIVHVEKGIQKAPMAAHDHDDHDGGEEDHAEEHGHDQAHGVLDPHVWLSPVLARTLATNTCRALTEVLPGHAAVFQAGLDALLRDMDALDADIAAVTGAIPEGRRSFMVFHPAWGYFARRYGLRQVPIEAEGKEPGPRQLAAIVRQGKEAGVAAVFVQPQFSDRSARVIAAEMGAEVVPLDPLAEDWAANLRAAARAFRKALR